mgnify:CR=1 FL=1
MPKHLHEPLTYTLIGAAMEVHRVLGPGFLEAVYHAALAHEFSLRDIPFESKKRLPVSYKGGLVGEYEADFVIEDKLILELKAVTTWHPKHEAQAIHYLTATGFRLALLLNFGTPSLEHKRIIK